MKRISIKSLQKQVAQASAFYGKPDVSPDEFFRYSTSPFLAKALLNISCSEKLFFKMSTDISSAEKELHGIEKIDMENTIQIIDQKIKKFRNKTIFSSVVILLLLLLVFLAKFSIGDVFAIIFFSCFIFVINFEAISKKITGLSISNLNEYKKLISYLSNQFVKYKYNIEYWSNLSWQNFEREVTKRLQRFGYNAINTKLSGDEGVDIVIWGQNKKFIIQCKASKNKIGPAYIRDFIGTIGIQNAAGGMIVSLNGFSSGSLEASSNYSNIYLFSIQDFILLDREKLERIIGYW
ncbi:MAG: restriction endonuclease [Candidatus Firestonebacteria bacterium]